MNASIPSVINVRAKLGLFSDHWSPRVVAELNDVQFKVAKFQGEFVWHQHDKTDEAFMVIAGQLVIDFRDGSITLGPGELTVIPKGVAHRPRAEQECQVLLIEPRGVVNTGEQTGPLTAPSDQWI